MNNQNKLINNIKKDVERQYTADDLFTQALQSLEAYDYAAANKIIKTALKTSDSIEQRIALQMLLILSEKKDNKLTDESLKIAYKNL